MLGGFSQGGAIALYGGLSSTHKLAGIIGLSTYLPLKAKIFSQTGPNKSTRVLMCHGEDDVVSLFLPSFFFRLPPHHRFLVLQVVALHWGKLSADTLKSGGINIAFKTYAGMGHSSGDKELIDVIGFLKEVVP